jgi:predicted nucleic acid-binding protein
MSFLVDTNVLLRSIEPHHPLNKDAVDAVSALLRASENVLILPQIVAEFWNVATRPKDKNGLGLSIVEVEVEVAQLEEILQVLPDIPAIYPPNRTADDRPPRQSV